MVRARNPLNLVNYCKSGAVNMSRPRITAEDISTAIEHYSADLGNEIGLEIRDVFPQADDILYSFLGASRRLTLREFYERFEQSAIPKDRYADLLEILLWFAFIGLVQPGGVDGTTVLYSYSVFYDLKKLRRLGKNYSDDTTVLAIHPAFWRFLEAK